MVTGRNSKFIGNGHLLGDISTTTYYTSSINAWSDYSVIKSDVYHLLQENSINIVIVALGPCASVLVFDIAKEFCIQALDVGHMLNVLNKHQNGVHFEDRL